MSKNLNKDKLCKYKWIVYKLSDIDQKKVWHNLQRKNNRLRHIETKINSNKSELTSSFKSKGHNLNLSNKKQINYSKSLSLIDTNIGSSINKNTGKSFSKLPRFKSSTLNLNYITYKDTLRVKDELSENKFISKHTNRGKCKSIKNDSLNIIKINGNPSSSFLTTQRTDLFDLDKIAKQYKFDKSDTETSIFAMNSAYWIRDNIGFKLKKQIKKENKICIPQITKIKENNKSKNDQKPKKRTKQRKKINMNGKAILINKNKERNNKKESELRLQHRRLVGSASLSNIFFPPLSMKNRASSRKSSAQTIKLMDNNINNKQNHKKTNDSNTIDSNTIDSQQTILNIKIRERTPLNHKQPKRYLYRNIFNKNDNSKKIFVLGSNYIQKSIVN